MVKISGVAGETSCARDMPDAYGNEFLDVFSLKFIQTDISDFSGWFPIF